jgi:hypothetical protein
MECEGVDWIHLAQDRDKWRALVNKVVNEDSCLLGCSATTQKTAIFVLTAVRTSNPTKVMNLRIA